jgi:formate hydrogenlyase subunit 6/NADH:ubiquinone oxidoreductase subunit I
VRHRWYRKFYYLMARYGRAFCVGCGRCARACTAKIGLVEVLNDLALEQENGSEPVAVGKGGGA